MFLERAVEDQRVAFKMPLFNVKWTHVNKSKYVLLCQKSHTDFNVPSTAAKNVASYILRMGDTSFLIPNYKV